MKTLSASSPFRIMTTLALAGALILAGSFHDGASVRAGTVITALTTSARTDAGAGKRVYPPRDRWKTITIYLDGNKMRMDSSDGGVIYHAGSGVMYMLSPRNKQYSEMTEASMKQMMQRADKAMELMRRQMAAMPPARRKMMEQMMKNQGGAMGGMGAKKPKVTYRAGKRGLRVGKWRCDVFYGYRQGKKVSENCIARMRQLGLRTRDLSVLNNLANMMKTMAGGRGDEGMSLSPDAIRAMAGFSGFPVQTLVFEQSGKTFKTVLHRIEQKSIPASVFQVPEGYTKTSMGR